MALLVFGIVLAAVVLGFTALARHVRRRGLAGGGVRGALAAYEEVFHGTGHDSYLVVQEQNQRTAPAPSPDDHLQ